MNEWTTPKGSKLPILNLRGKPYLQVAHRLVWFREERPTWSIQTEFVELQKDFAIAKATIFDENSAIIAMAHKKEDQKGFFDFMEKAETGAIGRALAFCGYGTQFCADEIEEGERLVDTPTQPLKSNKSATSYPEPKATPTTPRSLENQSSQKMNSAGDFVVPFGKSKGKTLSELGGEAVSKLMRQTKNSDLKLKDGSLWKDSDSVKQFLFWADAYMRLKIETTEEPNELDQALNTPPPEPPAEWVNEDIPWS